MKARACSSADSVGPGRRLGREPLCRAHHRTGRPVHGVKVVATFGGAAHVARPAFDTGYNATWRAATGVTKAGVPLGAVIAAAGSPLPMGPWRPGLRTSGPVMPEPRG
jgi:hypothetical protein